jgi:hypothetical protein
MPAQSKETCGHFSCACLHVREMCLCTFVSTRAWVRVGACMHVTCAYACKCVHADAQVFAICMCIYEPVSVPVCLCLCVYVYVCAYVCMHVCMHVCMCLCVCVCVCVHACVCVHLLAILPTGKSNSRKRVNPWFQKAPICHRLQTHHEQFYPK